MIAFLNLRDPFHSNIFLFYETANGLSQRGILSKLQNYQPSTSLLVKQQHHILSGCQTNIRILQDAGDPSKSIQQQQQPSILSRLSVKGDLVKKASDKPCGQNTYNQLMKFAKCGLSDTIPLLPIFNSFDDHHTKVVPKKITPRGITIYRKFLNWKKDDYFSGFSASFDLVRIFCAKRFFWN